MKAIESVSPVMVVTILTVLPRPTAMQTSATESSTSNAISYSVALYILIGIAAFYSMVTLICCVVVVLNCLNGRLKKFKRRDTPYRDIQLPLRTRMDTIVEESECSRSSSQVSILKKQRNEFGALSFSNKSALEDLENEPRTTETVLADEPGGSNLFFANKTALDLEHDVAGTEDTGKIPERGSAITTSFKRVVAIGNIGGDTKAENLQPNDSPLMRYSPRSVAVPPDEVKVPFSEDEAEKKAGKNQHRSRSPLSFERSSSPGSPFRKRKNPEKEIPSTAEKTDLTDFRRRKSSSGIQPSNKEDLTKELGATGSSYRLSPLARNSPKLKSNSVGVAANTSTPIRSRPIPAHPVRSSPSHSPFLVARASKEPTSSLAVHSTSSTNNGPPGTLTNSTGSNVSILTSETLLKKLQPVKRKWYIIGTQLNFPARLLNIIKLEQRNSDDKCLARLCEEWVESENEAMWPTVVDALRSNLVGERDLAYILEQEYCSAESSNSKTWL